MSINLGQVASIHIGNTAPNNTYLLWCATDDPNPQIANIIEFRQYQRSTNTWIPVGNTTQIIDALTSTLTDAALSANQGRILNNQVQANIGSISNVFLNLTNQLTQYVKKNTANQPNGYLKLTQFNQIPDQYQIQGALIPKGNWDASSGNPPTNNPQDGWTYFVIVPGTTNLNGYNDWDIGDFLFYANNQWNKVPNVSIQLYDGLDSQSTALALTAKQGHILKGLIETAQAEHTTINNNISTNQQDITQNQQTINSLAATINQMAGTINTLQNDYNQIQSDIQDNTWLFEAIHLTNTTSYTSAIAIGKDKSRLLIIYEQSVLSASKQWQDNNNSFNPATGEIKFPIQVTGRVEIYIKPKNIQIP